MEGDKFIYKLSNGGLIKLTKEVLVAVEAYKQENKGDTEAGGVLLDRFIKFGEVWSFLTILKNKTPRKFNICRTFERFEAT